MATCGLHTTPGNVWCLVSSSSHNELQVKEVAAYALSLLRPGVDAAVLPADSSTRDFADFCREVLGVKDPQLIWVPNQTGYITARDLDAATARHIKQYIQQQQQQKNDGHGCVHEEQHEQPQQAATAVASVDGWQLVPYGVTPALQQWMAEHQLGLPLLCDDARLGHKGIMHRHVRQLDKPSKVCYLSVEVEALDPSIAVPHGYSCSTVEDLLVAFRLIGRAEAVVKPLYGKEGQGVLFVSSPEELRLYDFPLGDVVLEEALLMDKGEDSIAVSATHLTVGQRLAGDYEKVCVGTVKFGMRSTQIPDDFSSTIQAWTSQITGLLAPAGPGYFHYCSVQGRPVLLGVRLGQLSAEHFAALFRQQHAPGCAFYCWTTALPHSLDVWTFWSRLQDHGAAFVPAAAPSAGGATDCSSPAGVFPLLFLKGSVSTLIAIGKDREQVAQLRRQTQRFNLSNRCIPLVRKGLDVIILPGAPRPVLLAAPRHVHSSKKTPQQPGEKFTLVPYAVTPNFQRWGSQLSEFGVSVFGESLEWIQQYGHKVQPPTQAARCDDLFVVASACTLRIARAQWCCAMGRGTMPNAATSAATVWMHLWFHGPWPQALASVSDNDVCDMVSDMDTCYMTCLQGILHRHIATPDQPSVIEGINSKIPVARGYYCETTQQLLDAYRALDVKDAVLKPVFGAAGIKL
ncbi:hypothetical protein COO60DRAFT_1672706 [Scenedesmus sp. NREL 46B-D3]|nr:hypothetical protein COO60DRAFT_1672706 [Scenedesmus sp. NREL 46B-D3]